MTAALLLAAGGSTRLGRSKQLVTHRGRTLLRAAAEALVAAGCEPVIVVLGADAARLRDELAGLDVRVAVNEGWTGGIATSIRRGVETLLDLEADADALLLAPCDQPRLTGEVLRRLIAAHDGSAEGCVACAYAGTVGVPALFGSAWFDRLARLAGDRGAKALLLDAGDRLVRVPWPDGAVDVDRPSDLDALDREQDR
jgi:molybdenum cofactor cytidylyltransferase